MQVDVIKATGFRELRDECGLEKFNVGVETQLSAGDDAERREPSKLLGSVQSLSCV